MKIESSPVHEEVVENCVINIENSGIERELEDLEGSKLISLR